MNTYLVIGGLVSFGANVVFYLLWREAEQRWNRRNEEPRTVLYMPDSPAATDASEVEPYRGEGGGGGIAVLEYKTVTPTIESQIAAAFPPDPVTAMVQAPSAPAEEAPSARNVTDSTAMVAVKQADVVPIKRRRKRKARG